MSFDIAAGLACGVGLYGYGAIFVLLLCAVAIISEKFMLFDKKDSQKTLRITIPENLNYQGAYQITVFFLAVMLMQILRKKRKDIHNREHLLKI